MNGNELVVYAAVVRAPPSSHITGRNSESIFCGQWSWEDEYLHGEMGDNVFFVTKYIFHNICIGENFIFKGKCMQL